MAKSKESSALDKLGKLLALSNALEPGVLRDAVKNHSKLMSENTKLKEELRVIKKRARMLEKANISLSLFKNRGHNGM